jgi:6-phospho-3-hexuloisomerase
VIGGVNESRLHAAVEAIAGAGAVALYGVGREGLQMRGLAMRLYHLGLRASVVGDMSCPPLGAGDLLVVSAGPGSFSTVAALLATARADGARTLIVTAQPSGACAAAADLVLAVPAQTMADDLAAPRSILPMGSLYEGALYLLFELMVLRLRDRLGVTPEAMRARHTNLE